MQNFVKRLIVKNMLVIILKMKRKNYIVDNIKKNGMVNRITKKIINDNKCKYLDCKIFTNKNFCNMHRYKCLSCDVRIKTEKLCKDHINPKCKHEKCNRVSVQVTFGFRLRLFR